MTAAAPHIAVVPERTEPKSIQGEQQERADTFYATEAEVERYVDDQDPGVITCRERGRHDYPGSRETGMHFVDLDRETGFYVRRVRCRSCDLVDRVELWDVRHKGDNITRCEFVSARPDYSVRGPGGERYQVPAGTGRMKPKQVRGVVATGMLKGQSFTDLRKEIRRAQRARHEVTE